MKKFATLLILVLVSISLLLREAQPDSPDWKSLEIPQLGPELAMPMKEIEPVSITAEEIETFLSLYRTSPDRSVIGHGLDLLRINSNLSAAGIELLESLFEMRDVRSFHRGNLLRRSGRLDFGELGYFSIGIDQKTGLLIESGWGGSIPSGESRDFHWSESPINQKTALRYFKNFLLSKNELFDSSVLTARSYGKGSLILLRHYYSGEIPRTFSPYYVVDAKTRSVRISKLEDTTIWTTVSSEVRPNSPENRFRFAKAHVALIHPEAKLISSVDDIPTRSGANPIDRDLRDAVRPITEIEYTGSEYPYSLNLVFYTYQQIGGGILRRHRFNFGWHPRLRHNPLESVIARDVGEALYRY